MFRFIWECYFILHNFCCSNLAFESNNVSRSRRPTTCSCGSSCNSQELTADALALDNNNKRTNSSQSGAASICRCMLSTCTKGFAGTPGFMAPEILKYNGEETYSERVDFFSFDIDFFSSTRSSRCGIRSRAKSKSRRSFAVIYLLFSTI